MKLLLRNKSITLPEENGGMLPTVRVFMKLYFCETTPLHRQRRMVGCCRPLEFHETTFAKQRYS
jgi:hypothetical protein